MSKRRTKTKKRTQARTAKKVSSPKRVMIVYGYDNDRRPKAAKFLEADFKLARKAAKATGLDVYEGEAIKLRTVLPKLQPGNVYASGPEFVGNVRQNLWERLISLMDVAPPAAPEISPQYKRPSYWSEIEVGHLVLGQADSAADGWWEAVVEEIDGDMLRLQARDFPDTPKVIRHRFAVALMFTDAYSARNGEDNAPALPASWDALAKNHVVLAQEIDPANGWGEATIIRVEGEVLSLSWRDSPRLPKFKRTRAALALLNPAPAN